MSVSGDGHEFMEVKKRLGGGKSPGGDEREYDLGTKKLDGTLHAKHAFVTFENSKILSAGEFHRRFQVKFPTAEMFGSREWHADGTSHYHVVMRFPRRKHFTNTRKSLLLDGEDGEVVVRVSVNKSIRSFLEGTQAYCARDNNPDTFGTWMDPRTRTGTRAKQKDREALVESEPRVRITPRTKRKHEALAEAKRNYETKRQKLRETDPRRIRLTV
ncbi:hypothetical protein P168DRAFT_324711 [Aspergillus campestris IBT 28561]|uniref:CRESS-DNA virus Rep endonuclease domain-containing protein n=1 Tax=Aspergillus campestris (strain IBT 28561) TaxID=1392248 RepID=A0A2I1DBN4_ASPC2|nr:uncharacterized protein P168DRAFT_324711 [Aspergillus campestris IBT 28561]PKY07285.1 hypothetical protein P168DRAFT_324711 [Aspergillus campestris IBT 28561]